MRDALHQAAAAEGCDFPGLGPHSFRRANITWRKQVGGSAIDASKIAGHSDLEMTGEYTIVTPERQNELTRRIQEKIAVEGRRTFPVQPQYQPKPQLHWRICLPDRRSSNNERLVEPQPIRNDLPNQVNNRRGLLGSALIR